MHHKVGHPGLHHTAWLVYHEWVKIALELFQLVEMWRKIFISSGLILSQ
jgi:hypothetical protein